MDVIESGNLAPGNTIQNVSYLVRPALLIAFLAASRRAEHSPDSEAHTSGFEQWHGPRVRAAGLMTGCVAAGFGVGFAIDMPLIGTLVGTLVGADLGAVVIARSAGKISAPHDGDDPMPRLPHGITPHHYAALSQVTVVDGKVGSMAVASDRPASV